MKIPNNEELLQINFSHLSHINFKNFLNLYKKCTVKTYSFLVNDTTLASNNTSRFRFNLFRKNKKTNYDN